MDKIFDATFMLAGYCVLIWIISRAARSVLLFIREIRPPKK